MFKWRLKFFFKVSAKTFLAVALLFFLFLLFERVRGQIAVARYKRLLVSKGEKLTPKDIMLSDAGENGAPEVFKLIRELKEGAAVPNSYPPMKALTPSGRAVIGFRETEWIDYKATNNWRGLAADLKTNEATLLKIRTALNSPVLNNRLDFNLGMKMNLMHEAPAKSLTKWFGASSQLALHNGQPHDTVDDVVQMIRLPRLLAEDRVAISELVRIAIASIGETAVWEALQTDGWTDDDLAKVQAAMQSQEFALAMARSLEGERVFSDVTYDLLRKSNDDTYRELSWIETFYQDEQEKAWFWEQIPGWNKVTAVFKKQIYCRIWRFAWSHQDQRRSLEQHQHLIEIARTAASEKSSFSVQPTIDKLAVESINKNWYDKLRYPQSILTLSKVMNRAMHAETERSMTLCAIALKRFSLRYGKFPKSLELLVPEFLQSVPVDYMDGKPVKYHPNPDGSFTLYSVGDDGKDDGGDAALPPEKKGSNNLWNRKDFIWPGPASPEEVAVWRKESARN